MNLQKKKKKDELQKNIKERNQDIRIQNQHQFGERGWRMEVNIIKKKKVQNTREPLQCMRQTARHYWKGSS